MAHLDDAVHGYVRVGLDQTRHKGKLSFKHVLTLMTTRNDNKAYLREFRLCD